MNRITPASLTKEFIDTRGSVDLTPEKSWLRSVFSAFLKVARNNPAFIVDDLWEEMDRLARRGKLESGRIDTRILGVMLRFLASVGVIEASGYYAKSARPGSRPVMVWTSLVYRSTARTAA